MSLVSPSSSVTFYKGVGLTDYENQYIFQSVSQQRNFFQPKIWRTYNDFQYVRHGGYLLIPETYDKMIMVDYLSFENINFGFKTWYAFVTSMSYVNDSTTRVDFTIDLFQTWMFEIGYEKTFIERTHQFDVPFYEKTTNFYPEGLEAGTEYLTVGTEFIDFSTGLYLVASSIRLDGYDFGTTDNPQLKSATGGDFDNVPSALDYYVVKKTIGQGGNTATLAETLQYLSAYPWISQGIHSITFIPQQFVDVNDLATVSIGNISIYKMKDGYTSSVVQKTYDFTSHFETGYLQKLYTFPYAFVEMTGYNGNSFTIRPQDVGSNSFTIYMQMQVGANPRIVIHVMGYLNGIAGQVTYSSGEYVNAGITFSDLPQFPILKDNYLLALANNANSRSASFETIYENKRIGDSLANTDLAVSGINRLINTVVNPASIVSNVTGMANDFYQRQKGDVNREVSTEQAIRKMNAAIDDLRLAPPSQIGTVGGDTFNISKRLFGVTLKWKTIFPQFADRINNYFIRYGYSTKKFMELGDCLYGNSELNYVKTVGCHLSGDIPQDDTENLQNMFDSGITLWHKQIGEWDRNERIT